MGTIEPTTDLEKGGVSSTQLDTRTTSISYSENEKHKTLGLPSQPPHTPFRWTRKFRSRLVVLASRLTWTARPPRTSTESHREETIVRQLKTFPRGYPNLATFTDSDEGFMVYRRFGYLQSRILLDKQTELGLLENKLDKLDESEKNEYPDRLFRYDLDSSEVYHRRQLMAEIEKRYCEYATVMGAAANLVALNRPSSAEYTSVLNYHRNVPRIHKSERSYIYHREDLVTLRPGREHAWLDCVIESVLKRVHCRPLEWMFCSKESLRKAEPADEDERPDEIYYSRERISRCAMVIITFMIIVLMILPIYLLLCRVNGTEGELTRHDTAMCIVILLFFTLAFSAMLVSFTSAKRHEVLGAAAAYCAILVVFFGNLGVGAS